MPSPKPTGFIMLIVISPAKTLDYESALPNVRATQPRMLDQSEELVNQLRELSSLDIAGLMHVSDKIASLNATRFSQWSRPFDKANARPALFAFMGDVYTGLAVRDFSPDELLQAQHRLRILSGLYGVLRPLDLMQPYRLEMGTRLLNDRGKDLYAFWDMTITDSLNKDLRAAKTDVLVNLASNEYFRSVKTKQLNGQIITPVFHDEKNGKFKVISFFAKKARGLMAAWIIQNNVTDAAKLTEFNVSGYRYSAQDSNGDNMVFRRREKDLPK
jgi:cytoplasmic iron level regulating protein YaaA (DUF328/UPF0246 family)